MGEVETDRLPLRRWHKDDLERLVALHGDPRVSRSLSVDGRPWLRERTVGVFEHFLCQWREHGFGPWAVIDRRTGRWLGGRRAAGGALQPPGFCRGAAS